MISLWMMKFLLFEYALIACACIYDNNYYTALYWAGAGIITLSFILR